MEKFLFKHESYQIIGAFFEVYNQLGPGFLESVYQEALAREFEEKGVEFREQWGIEVYYKEILLNKKFYADFLCFDAIIIEIKAMDGLVPEHESQLLNYLKATQKPLGFLVNFGGSSLVYKRFANTKNV